MYLSKQGHIIILAALDLLKDFAQDNALSQIHWFKDQKAPTEATIVSLMEEVEQESKLPSGSDKVTTLQNPSTNLIKNVQDIEEYINDDIIDTYNDTIFKTDDDKWWQIGLITEIVSINPEEALDIIENDILNLTVNDPHIPHLESLADKCYEMMNNKKRTND